MARVSMMRAPATILEPDQLEEQVEVEDLQLPANCNFNSAEFIEHLGRNAQEVENYDRYPTASQPRQDNILTSPFNNDITTLNIENNDGTTQPITHDILEIILNVGHLYMMTMPTGELKDDDEDEVLNSTTHVAQDANGPMGDSSTEPPSTQTETAAKDGSRHYYY